MGSVCFQPLCCCVLLNADFCLGIVYFAIIMPQNNNQSPPLPPPPSYLSCVQWYMHVSIMALRSQNTRQPMNNRLGAWAMLHLQCKWKFIYVHTSRWKVQKALEKCFPNAFSTFFSLFHTLAPRRIAKWLLICLCQKTNYIFH